jgi:hypothetical protein
MSMEKNGAISSDTPGCCGGGGCDSKKAQDEQRLLFPETAQEADTLEEDLTKRAVDSVKAASTPKQ